MKRENAFSFFNSEYSIEDLIDQELFIEVEKKKYPASILLKPLNNLLKENRD